MSAQRACVGRVLPLACSHGKSSGPVRPLPDCAILVPPVHDGGLGSRLRVFPKPPTEAAFAFHALADPNVADGEAASNLGGDA